ncbi:hypothetical protein [Streptomyces cavourensis]|uniref:hypothetical protein n=1 Tax=Streptomyces cavourensis TaxID=67258 RepID=UPI0020C95020|nr:hypothetical protein [Streptomyces cavourensis]
MLSRAVAIVTAFVLFGEAVGIFAVNAVLATVTENQNMSLAGMDPKAMTTGTWALGGASALLLVGCGLIPLLAGVRDRAPGRIALIGCAVVHGVLGAVTVGLAGWGAFAFMMVVLALLVLTLLAYGPDPGGDDRTGDGKAAPAAA